MATTSVGLVRSFVLSLGLLIECCGGAGAGLIINPGDTWRYVNTDQSHPAPVSTTGFQAVGYDDSQWFIGNAPFSNVDSGDFASNTFWQADFDPLVRKTFTLTSVGDATAYIGVDNGFTLYVNGNLVASDNAEGFTFRWEYVIPIPQSDFVVGTNVVALALEDHGGLTAFDMQLDLQPSAVPEPSTLTLFGCAGLMGLAGAWMRRRCDRDRVAEP
jgi:hypothetical protein